MTGFGEIAAAGPVLAALGVSVLAGLVSFASPCVVPLVPGYLSYLAAVVGVEDEPRLARRDSRLGEEVREEATETSISTKPRGFASRERPPCSWRGSPRCSCSARSRCSA